MKVTIYLRNLETRAHSANVTVIVNPQLTPSLTFPGLVGGGSIEKAAYLFSETPVSYQFTAHIFCLVI